MTINVDETKPPHFDSVVALYALRGYRVQPVRGNTGVPLALAVLVSTLEKRLELEAEMGPTYPYQFIDDFREYVDVDGVQVFFHVVPPRNNSPVETKEKEEFLLHAKRCFKKADYNPTTITTFGWPSLPSHPPEVLARKFAKDFLDNAFVQDPEDEEMEREAQGDDYEPPELPERVEAKIIRRVTTVTTQEIFHEIRTKP